MIHRNAGEASRRPLGSSVLAIAVRVPGLVAWLAGNWLAIRAVESPHVSHAHCGAELGFVMSLTVTGKFRRREYGVAPAAGSRFRSAITDWAARLIGVFFLMAC